MIRQGLVIYRTMDTIETLSYRRQRPIPLPRFRLAVIHSSILILSSFGQLLLLKVLVMNNVSFYLIGDRITKLQLKTFDSLYKIRLRTNKETKDVLVKADRSLWNQDVILILTIYCSKKRVLSPLQLRHPMENFALL